MLDLSRERGLTLATAGSITGGGIGARLTSFPGSSDVFLGGVVAYSRRRQASLLGVPAKRSRSYGAVSAETAAAMAKASEAAGRRRGGAGDGRGRPGGGTAEKPVGLVYFHAAGPDGGAARSSRAGRPGDLRARATRDGSAHVAASLVTEPAEE